MKKIGLLIISILLLTGCSNIYELNITKDGINENIELELDENIYEEESDSEGPNIISELKNNIPLLNDNSRYYTKNINVDNNIIYARLKGSYSYNEFKNSYLINRCFENVFIDNNDEYLYISLSGFNCVFNQDIYIAISSEYDVTKENALDYQDGYYLWNLKNIDNIEFSISKNEIEVSNNTFITVLRVVLIALFVVSGVTIFIIKKNND